jgi:drug/metabolite transporter (DMT)-like permease
MLTLASLGWAAGSLYSRRAALPSSPLLATGIQMLAGGTLMLVAGGLLGEFGQIDLARASTRSIVAFAYLVMAAVVAFTAYLWVLRVASPVLVSTYSYINPLIAVFLGWALAGEPLTARTGLAALVIVSGVALITVPRTAAVPPRSPQRNPPEPPESRGREGEPALVLALAAGVEGVEDAECVGCEA